MNISSFTDEQLLNLINNSILKNTEFSIDDFTGGSVSATSVHKNTRQNYKVNLYFGYKGKNSINRSFDIKGEFYFIWCKAIHLKVISIANENVGADFNELNELMKSKDAVVSSKLDSNTVVSISTESKGNRKVTLQDKISEKLLECNNINLEAFNEWVGHKKYKTIAPITKLLNMLSKYTQQQQQEIVDKSIMNEWKGLIEPSRQSQSRKSFKREDKERNDREFEAISQRNIFDIIDEMEVMPNEVQGVICE